MTIASLPNLSTEELLLIDMALFHRARALRAEAACRSDQMESYRLRSMAEAYDDLAKKIRGEK